MSFFFENCGQFERKSYCVIIANTTLSVPIMLLLRRENDKIITLQGHGDCGPKSEQRRYRLMKHCIIIKMRGLIVGMYSSSS